MLRKPRETCIDGVRLDRFEPGFEYEVGSSLAALFFAEGWAEPLPFDFGEQEPTIPVDEAPVSEKRPRNLMRQRYSSGTERLSTAQDIDRTRSRRPPKPSSRTPPKRPPSR
jgi:hypothetical protein